MFKFMAKPKLSRSIRKYIRRQKSLIRRSFSVGNEAEQKVKELIQKFKVNG